MDELKKELFGGDTDHAVARKNAERIAGLVNSRVQENEEIILYELYYPFKVPFHSKAFHGFFLIADASYSFTAKRRPKTPWVEDFRVSFKEFDRVGGARVLSPELSTLIGVKVFRLPRSPDDAIDVAFSTRLLTLLRQVQFNRVQQFRFSPVTLEVEASIDSPEFCVEQARLFHNLMTLANQEACERNKVLLE